MFWATLRARIGEIAAVKRRYGYRRVHVVLRRESWTMNRKLTYRLYPGGRPRRAATQAQADRALRAAALAEAACSQSELVDGLRRRRVGGRPRPSLPAPVTALGVTWL